MSTDTPQTETETDAPTTTETTADTSTDTTHDGPTDRYEELPESMQNEIDRTLDDERRPSYQPIEEHDAHQSVPSDELPLGPSRTERLKGWASRQRRRLARWLRD